MVYLLAAPKGSGKTQQLIELANKTVNEVDGNVVFIKKTHSDTARVNFSIRTICMDDYPVIASTDAYIGFIYGMYSANSDIEVVYIDGILKHANITIQNMSGFVGQLNKIAAETGIKFYVSISADKEVLEAIPDVEFI